MHFRAYVTVFFSLILFVFLIWREIAPCDTESCRLGSVTVDREPKTLPKVPYAPFDSHEHTQWQFSGDRAVVPLLVTDLGYHGVGILRTTIRGWIYNLFIPQGNIDLIIYYDTLQIELSDLIQRTGFIKCQEEEHSRRNINVSYTKEGVVISNETRKLLGNGCFYTSHALQSQFNITIVPTAVHFPLYIQKEPWLLNSSGWLECGCPPYCPVKKATVNYIQGTRWYSLDLFLEPTIRSYKFWIKMDMDIWIFRNLIINIVDKMNQEGAIAAHTGKSYNGHGCSNELDSAIRSFYNCSTKRTAPCSSIKSSEKQWWQQDDKVYYTNFVVYKVDFFLRKDVTELSHFLNEYRNGFFRYRWTDQSLSHKVLGVFHGPDEGDFILDWSYMRWKRGVFRKRAIFWHGKGSKTTKDIKRYTSLK